MSIVRITQCARIPLRDSKHSGETFLIQTLQEYLLSWEQLTEKMARFDKRIEELAQLPAYYETVRKLGCLKGIATHTA